MKIGFLGAGAMGGAILSGGLSTGALRAEEVFLCDHLPANREKFAALGCHICEGGEELGTCCDVVVLAVKPQAAAAALAELGQSVAGKAVVSIMAGVTTERLRGMIAGEVRVLRVMPNTPALVGSGAFACCAETDLREEEREFIEQLFRSIGIVEWMSEKLIDTACGLSGSGPAFVALLIEALADGGVLEGMPRAMAYRLAAQTVLGTAQMVLQTGMHPAQLKDMVTSPAGTTIAGCRVLEEKGFRAAAIGAVQAATRRSREL